MTEGGIDRNWRPEHGSLKREFGFDPLHHGAPASKRADFIVRVQSNLDVFGFLLIGEVRIRWSLFVDEQDRLETPNGADVDNFAKLLNDALKGSDGLLVDDGQVQSLEIAWIDTFEPPHFELQVDCRPDEVLDKPVTLYEMPDGLWYPMSDYSYETIASFCFGLSQMVKRYQRVRHHLRTMGCSKQEAYRASKPIKSLATGFHKTRIADSTFELAPMRVWQTWDAYLSRTERRLVSTDIEAEARSLAERLLPKRRRSD